MYLNYVSWPESPVTEVSQLADETESSPGKEKMAFGTSKGKCEVC